MTTEIYDASNKYHKWQVIVYCNKELLLKMSYKYFLRDTSNTVAWKSQHLHKFVFFVGLDKKKTSKHQFLEILLKFRERIIFLFG